MNAIPDDIWYKATEAYEENVGLDRIGLKSTYNKYEIESIARAILAERERCETERSDLLEMLKELVEAFDDEVMGHKRKEQAEIVIAAYL